MYTVRDVVSNCQSVRLNQGRGASALIMLMLLPVHLTLVNAERTEHTIALVSRQSLHAENRFICMKKALYNRLQLTVVHHRLS